MAAKRRRRRKRHNPNHVANTPRRRRHNPVAQWNSPRRHRRRRHNPVANSPRRHHRRYRRNQPDIGLNVMDTVQKVAMAGIGFFGPPLLKQTIPMLNFGATRYSWTDIATDAAYGIGIGFVAAQFAGRRVANAIYLGTGMLVLFDIVVKFFGPQVGMASAGTSTAAGLGYSYYYPAPVRAGAGYPYAAYMGYRAGAQKMLAPQRGIAPNLHVSSVVPGRSGIRI